MKRPLGPAVLTREVRRRPGPGEGLVDVGHDAIGHASAVLLPGPAILRPALALITRLAMKQQQGKVDHVEIGQNVLKTTGEGPRQGHDEITQVIGVTNEAPPSRN